MTTGSDVALRNTEDGGDITITNGVVELSGGLESAVYMSLFGGNVDDPGDRQSPLQWWGNLDETNPAKRHRSRTQHLLRSIPSTAFNLNRINDAVTADLDWLVSEGVATSVSVDVSLESLNRVGIVVTINYDEREAVLTFGANWRADA